MASFLTWVADPTVPGGKRLENILLLTCPGCKQPAGYLYKETGTCVGCQVGWDEDLEDEQAAEHWEKEEPEFSFWDRCDAEYDRWVDAQFATC